MCDTDPNTLCLYYCITISGDFFLQCTYKFSDKNNEDSHDSSKQVVSTAVLDEEGYLPPRTLKVGQNYDSDDNDDEYLKPTFGKFTRIGKNIF